MIRLHKKSSNHCSAQNSVVPPLQPSTRDRQCECSKLRYCHHLPQRWPLQDSRDDQDVHIWEAQFLQEPNLFASISTLVLHRSTALCFLSEGLSSMRGSLLAKSLLKKPWANTDVFFLFLCVSLHLLLHNYYYVFTTSSFESNLFATIDIFYYLLLSVSHS